MQKNATQQQIKKAYKDLARKWHPDKHNTESSEKIEEATAKFKDINEAYTVLTAV